MLLTVLLKSDGDLAKLVDGRCRHVLIHNLRDVLAQDFAQVDNLRLSRSDAPKPQWMIQQRFWRE
jgi:hypothetical protein